MSRAAILDALRSSTALESFVPNGNIIANPQGEGRPDDLIPNNFIVLRWGEQDWNQVVRRGPRNLTVWAHTPKELSTSYNDIDKILGIVTYIISPIEMQLGADGWKITMCWPSGGWSGDLVDVGYNTISKNAGFKILTNPV